MRILTSYSQNNLYYSKQPVFKGSAIPMSAEAISRLPARTQKLIREAQLEQVVKGTSVAEQRVLAGVIPTIIAPVKTALALTKKQKRLPFLDDTRQALESVLQRLDQAQQVLPTPKASIKAPKGIDPELAEMSAQRTPKYIALDGILTKGNCSVESVQEILKGRLLKPIPPEHRFELVEKMLDVAVKRKSPELIGELFNYVFVPNKRGWGILVNPNLTNVDCCSTLRKFFDAGTTTGNHKVVYASYINGMDKFNQELNNAAIEFAAKTTEMNFVKRVLIHTEANFDDAKPDREKLAGLIEKYLCVEMPKNIDRPNPPADVEFINALIPRMPNKFRKIIRENVATDLDGKLGKDRAKDKEKVLKWYFTPARKQID